MATFDEGSETMSLCPMCREDASNEPDPKCTTCDGAGLVSGAAFIEWQSEGRQRIPKSE